MMPDHLQLVFMSGELAGSLFLSRFSDKIGRKRCLSIFPLMAAFLLISTSLLNAPFAGTSPGRDWLLIALPLIGRIAISVTYQSSILYANELFPTCVRNTGCRMAYVARSIRVLLSSYSRTLVRHVALAPNVMFDALCISLPLAIRSLPGTLGREPPQTLEKTSASHNGVYRESLNQIAKMFEPLKAMLYSKL